MAIPRPWLGWSRTWERPTKPVATPAMASGMPTMKQHPEPTTEVMPRIMLTRQSWFVELLAGIGPRGWP